MNETLRDYTIVDRYLVTDEGWRVEEITLCGTTLDDAWRKASEHAKLLDQQYGGDHFWTVDVLNPQGEGYVQLFHGRLV
jgi:hypothetical protein